ncbi:hypothetical protein F4776DRAFT_616192 [Hypoxylon sp. NC0597]|nr:hypothetical protein F4776DRAFT_616192 [Hypoxylon sp. NC0597]
MLISNSYMSLGTTGNHLMQILLWFLYNCFFAVAVSLVSAFLKRILIIILYCGIRLATCIVKYMYEGNVCMYLGICVLCNKGCLGAWATPAPFSLAFEL